MLLGVCCFMRVVCLIVVCSLLFVGWRVLFVVLLFCSVCVMCCVSFVVYSVLDVVCCELCGVRCVLVVDSGFVFRVCCMSFVVGRCSLYVDCCLTIVVCCVLCVGY